MNRSQPKRSRTRKIRKRGFWYLLKRRFNKRSRQKKEVKPSDLRRRYQIRKRNFLIWSISISALIVIGLFVGLWKLARADRFLIQNIDIRGVDVVSEEEVEEAVHSNMKGSVAFFFPRQNSFFVPIARIEAELKDKFIAVDHTNVLRKGLDELIVVIREREPATILCEEKVDHIGRCFFADKTGVMYREVPHIARSQYQTIYIEDRDDEELLGAILLNEKEVEALSVFIEMLREKGDIKIERIYLDSDRYLKLGSDAGYSVLVHVQEDYTSELSRLLASLGSDVFKDDVPLESVYEFDLRFGRKVFYRFDEGAKVE